jgi:hypothetical protein
MTRLVQIAAELQRFLDAKSWPNCIIGGIAVQRWGEPRLTEDVDLTLLTGFGHEEPYIDALLARYPARIESPRDFALAHRVVLLKTDDGVGIDIALGGLQFESNAIARATHFEFTSGERIRTCSAEDLVVMKALAGRDQDWMDIKGVLIRQGNLLNWGVILPELRPLCELKEAPEIVTHLERLQKQVDQQTVGGASL